MKRKFSILLAIACLFSCFTFGGVAHADAATFTDVTNSTQYSEAIFTLTKLGIINGYLNDDNTTYSFKPNGDITRGEFAKIITVALGIDAESATGTHDFTDIDNHWAKPYVITAAGRGIVNGFEDKTFRPDENVTYEQAVKMIVCAAGYETIAQARGGWPKGYISQANELGITADAMTANQSAKASRGIVGQLMYNVLDVDVLKMGTGGAIDTEYSKTFMEEYLGVYRVSATIVGVEDKVTKDFTGQLYLEEMAIKLRDGSIVEMDYTTYTEDKSIIENYLGHEVIVYYREGKSGDANTLFELDFNSVKNTVSTISSENISGYTSNSLKYYDDNDRLRNVTIDPAVASVYYNGKIVSSPASYMSTWFDPNHANFIYGEVKLTDSGDDGAIDVVEISDYYIMVVAKTPSTADYVVSNKVKFVEDTIKGYVIPADYKSSVTLDPGSVVYTVNITNEAGNSVQVTSLKANDVLLVAESLDSTIFNVKVTSNAVTGKISGVSSNGEITINSKTYKVSDYATEYFKQNNITIAATNSGTFYVDAYGAIVYGTQTATAQSTSPYVYITRVVENDDETTGTLTAYVPSSNAVKKYNLSGKIKYNGTPKTVAEVVADLRNNMPADGLTANFAVPDAGVCYDSGAVNLTNACQVARITIEGNDVKEINVAESATLGNVVEGAITPYLALDSKTKYTGSNNFDGKFYVNSSTTFIFVPQDRTADKSYAKKTVSSFSSGSQYWVQPYNVNSSKIADLVLVYGKETETVTVKKTTQVSLLAQNHSIKIDDDEELYDVNYYSNSDQVKNASASKTENCDTDATDDYTEYDIGNLSYGDFFRAGSDTKLGLVNAELVLDYDTVLDKIENHDSDFTGIEWTSFGSPYGRLIVANVYEILDDNGKYSLRVSRNGFDSNGELSLATEELVSIASDTVIYRVDTVNETITPYKDGSESERLTADDMHEAKYEGTSASRIAVYSYSTNYAQGRPVKMILIYQ